MISCAKSNRDSPRTDSIRVIVVKTPTNAGVVGRWFVHAQHRNSPGKIHPTITLVLHFYANTNTAACRFHQPTGI